MTRRSRHRGIGGGGVAHLDVHRRVVVAQLDANLRAGCVPGRVRQRLLQDAIRRETNGGAYGHAVAVPVRAAVGLSAYRILQESLANAARHAPGAQVRVELRYDDAAVHLEVRTAASPDAPAPGPPGHGIAGMRERAAVVGGTLSAGPDTDGGFAVAATLPLAVEAVRLPTAP